MKLSKIYSNQYAIFEPIDFNDGFNVILGEIRLPKNRKKDTHNLGKSKLAEVIYFCLLKKRNKNQFLFKHYDKFENFTFFLELKINSGEYVTVRRSVSSNTKIAIKKHTVQYQDFVNLSDNKWDYCNINIDKAIQLLDAIFSLKVIAPWTYKNAINFSLRSQSDFKDIFKLSNFIGKHLFWKPYVGKNLGFNADNLKANYELQYIIESLDDKISELLVEIGRFQGDGEEEIFYGLLGIKKQEAESLQKQLDTFNFGESDSVAIKKLSNEVDQEIAELNKVKYYLSINLNKLKKTIEGQDVSFDISTTKELFQEAGVLFTEQITTSYEDLLEFNKQITVERQLFVNQQIQDLESEMSGVVECLSSLNEEKSKKLSYLNSIDTFEKYKELTSYLVLVNTEINDINRKLSISEKIKDKRKQYREFTREKSDVIDRIRENREYVTTSEDGIYKSIKEHFTDFVKKVLDKNGFISTEQNKEGNLEFLAGIIDAQGKYTSEADGHSYKKILCIGYDIAVNLAYSSQDFIRFIYHDGGLETLDERKKKEFLKYIREISGQYNLQYILTVIDSDIPKGIEFTEKEIAITLHDDGKEGRLFKMESW